MDAPREQDRGSSHSSNSPFLVRHMSLPREIFMLVTLVCTQVFVLACLSQGIFPDSIIGKSFTGGQSDGSENTWGPAAYGLTSGTFMLPAGRLGDMYGHRWCYIAAWAWLAGASLLTGISVYSRSFVFYAICRGLQGISTAMLIPCALAILGSVYKEGPRKSLAFSLFAAGSPTGFTIGGVFSGLLAELSWWPWIFWVTAIASCCISAVAYFSIPQLPSDRSRDISLEQQDGHNTKPRWRRDFDWLGTATGVSGLVLFNVAWNQAPAVGWQAPSNIATVIIGFGLILAFLFVERRVRHPLIPVDRLKAESIFVLATMALAWASFGILVFYLVNFLIRIRGDTILSTAAQFVPVPLAGFAASYFNTFLLGRSIPPADVLAFSCIWFIAGNALLATLPAHQSFWKQVFWINILAPLGIDLSFPSATLLMSQLVPPEQQGIAASLIATAVYYSQSIGLGIAGTVQSYVEDGNLIRGYRGASFTGVGLSGLGLLISLWPVIEIRIRKGSAGNLIRK